MCGNVGVRISCGTRSQTFTHVCACPFHHVQVLCASIDDEPRFTELLTRLIEEGALPSYPAFVKESQQKRKRRRRRYEEEAKEAEEAKRREGLDEGKGNVVPLWWWDFTKWLLML